MNMEASYTQSRFGPIVQRLERMPYKRVMKFRLLLGPPFYYILKRMYGRVV